MVVWSSGVWGEWGLGWRSVGCGLEDLQIRGYPVARSRGGIDPNRFLQAIAVVFCLRQDDWRFNGALLKAAVAPERSSASVPLCC